MWPYLDRQPDEAGNRLDSMAPRHVKNLILVNSTKIARRVTTHSGQQVPIVSTSVLIDTIAEQATAYPLGHTPGE